MKDIVKAFDGRKVRAIIIRGEPWFVAKDVCDVLEISNSRDAVASLDDDQKGVANTDTLGGSQEVQTVNESGLYALVFRSRKPEAKAFRKWITSEVLPSIRKTGRYTVDPEARKKSAQSRSLLAEQWHLHGAEKPHHFINLTRAEYKALGYGSGVGIHKDDMTDTERARLEIFETLERYQLMTHPEIEGYHQLAASVEHTGQVHAALIAAVERKEIA